ncbi:MAG: hypothetical protein AB7D03_11540 [Thiomicrospira sp.]
MSQVIDVLNRVDKNALKHLIETFNNQGFIIDDGETFVSSTIIEEWSDECTGELILKGFKGGCLIKYGDYFEHYGAIYCLYDEEKFDLDTVKDLLEKIASQHPLKTGNK